MIKRIAIGIFIVLIIAGVGYYAWVNYGYQHLPTKQTTLYELGASQSSQVCTFTENGVSGKIYVSGTSTRRELGDDFTIFDGKNTYTWSKNSQFGAQVPYVPRQTPLPKNSYTSSVYSNVNTVYNCRPWLANQSLFVPPSNITFSTLQTPTVPNPNTQNGATASPSAKSQ